MEREDDREDDYAEHNSRRKLSISQLPPISREASLPNSHRPLYSESQLITSPTAEYNLNNHEPPPASNPYFGDMGDDSKETSQDREVTNETAAALFQSPINGPGDALHLLLEASGRSEDINRHQNRLQNNQRHSLANEFGATPITYSDQRAHDGLARVIQSQPGNIDPAIITGHLPALDTNTADYHEAINVWSRLRFVRAGWLTATEAMSYID